MTKRVAKINGKEVDVFTCKTAGCLRENCNETTTISRAVCDEIQGMIETCEFPYLEEEISFETCLLGTIDGTAMFFGKVVAAAAMSYQGNPDVMETKIQEGVTEILQKFGNELIFYSRSFAEAMQKETKEEKTES